MEKENREMNDVEISKLISSKIAAEDADSGWVVAWTMLRVLPVLKELAQGLGAINEAIAPDDKNAPSIVDALREIRTTLEKFGGAILGDERR
jgi:hypothetical protein